MPKTKANKDQIIEAIKRSLSWLQNRKLSGGKQVKRTEVLKTDPLFILEVQQARRRRRRELRELDRRLERQRQLEQQLPPAAPPRRRQRPNNEPPEGQQTVTDVVETLIRNLRQQPSPEEEAAIAGLLALREGPGPEEQFDQEAIQAEIERLFGNH